MTQGFGHLKILASSCWSSAAQGSWGSACTAIPPTPGLPSGALFHLRHTAWNPAPRPQPGKLREGEEGAPADHWHPRRSQPGLLSSNRRWTRRLSLSLEGGTAATPGRKTSAKKTAGRGPGPAWHMASGIHPKPTPPIIKLLLVWGNLSWAFCNSQLKESWRMHTSEPQNFGCKMDPENHTVQWFLNFFKRWKRFFLKETLSVECQCRKRLKQQHTLVEAETPRH